MHLGSRVSDLLDGRLSAAEAEQLRAHIGHCIRCAQLVHAEEHVRDLLRGYGQQTSASEELMAGLLRLPEGVGDRPVRQVPAAGRRARVGLLAAGAAVTLGVAAPFAAGAAPAALSVLPQLWQRDADTSTIVMVPAGPRAAVHTTVLYERDDDDHP